MATEGYVNFGLRKYLKTGVLNFFWVYGSLDFENYFNSLHLNNDNKLTCDFISRMFNFNTIK